MTKFACKADLWYNKALKMFVTAMLQTSRDRTHLNWRCIVTTLPPHDQNGNSSIEKICSKCKRTLPLTDEYFHQEKRRRGGFRSDCKACRSTSKRIVLPDGQKRCNGPCGRILPSTTEHFHERKASRDGLQHVCKDCRLEYDNHNRDRKRANAKVHDSIPENKERRRANEKARRNNPETREGFLAAKRANYHSPKSKAHLKDYYKKPEVRDRKKANTKARYHNPITGLYVREQKRAYTLNRIARKKAIPGTYTVSQIQDQLKRQRYRCYYAACGHAKFEKVNGKHIYHIDHTFPISRIAGTNIPANDISYLVLACPTCNMSKGDKFPWEWPEGGRLF